MMKLRQMLLNYTPCDMQEAQDRQMMLDALDNLRDVFTRITNLPTLPLHPGLSTRIAITR